jgi:glyoxylase-like metal-dependent hydrolase (beta-lactamase superfamily II)
VAEIPTYEVYAVRYATNPAQRRPQNFVGGDPHDMPMPLDYFVWAVKGPERVFIVDTGFDAAMAEKRKREFLASPDKTLHKIGINAHDVEDVIITHMHYDHCGNYALFPKARFHLQDMEMEYATGRFMRDPAHHVAFEADDVVAMVRRVFERRVTFHDKDFELAPGLSVHHIGGHTKGMQVVRVWTRRGWLVLASDASHFYAHMDERRAFPVLYNLDDVLAGYERLRELASNDKAIIPGHDPLVRARYPAPRRELEGLVVCLDADPC